MSSSSAAESTSVFTFPPPPTPSVDIVGSDKAFPVHRIYCVGRNYADHVREMGGDPKRSSPTFFTKPADAVVPTKTNVPYPLNTSNLHYEVELVVAIGKEGCNIPISEANEYIFGYGVGIDFTRRDHQSNAKEARGPWDTAKAFDQSAPMSAILPATTNLEETSQISLTVNGEVKQSGNLNQMIWSIPEVISQLSNNFILKSGDLIFTGTPSGVGPVVKGDTIKSMVDGLEDVEVTLV